MDKYNPLLRLEELAAGADQNTGVSVRILTSHLRPEKGIKSFWVSEKIDTHKTAQQVEKAFSDLADKFVKKVEAHCRSCIASKLNAECERLLAETASKTEG